MTLKLAKLPNRTPIKMTMMFPPDIHEALTDYANIYARQYGVTEKIENLVPYMIAGFLNTDSGFRKARRDRAANIAKSNECSPIATDHRGDNS